MGIVFDTFLSLLLLTILLAGAIFIFSRVRSDYQSHGKLSRPIAILQVGYFCAYALSSYVFLDSRLSQIKPHGLLFFPALIFMTVGFLMVAFSMPFLGRQSFGQEISNLRSDGIYHYSRNPQLVGGFLFIVGYTSLWPSWDGMVWAGLWLVITHLMVQGEEAHLRKVFGDKYLDYCARTPRYLGFPKR